jgi:hypothetical protein
MVKGCSFSLWLLNFNIAVSRVVDCNANMFELAGLVGNTSDWFVTHGSPRLLVMTASKCFIAVLL